MHRLSIAPLALLAACGPTYDDIVHDWAVASGHTFEDCGAIELGQCSTAVGVAPAAITCLLDAFASCTASRAEISMPTVEGDPIVETWFIDPQEDGTCTAVLFRDTTADEFGPQEINQYDCSTLSVLDECPWYASDGCGDPVETW